MDKPLNKTTVVEAMLTELACGADDRKNSISEQELIALVSGDVEPAQRSALLEKLAVNKSAYLHWLALLETKQQLDQNTVESKDLIVEKDSKNSAFWQNLRDAWNFWWLAPAFALVLVVVVVPKSFQQAPVDALYQDWSGQLQGNINGHTETVRGDSVRVPEKSLQQQWFEFGLWQGLQRLGDNFAVTGLPEYQLTQQRPDPVAGDINIAQAAEVTLLVYFACQQGVDGDFYNEAITLLKGFDSIPQEWNIAVKQTMQGQQTDATQTATELCDGAMQLIKQVILSNQ